MWLLQVCKFLQNVTVITNEGITKYTGLVKF